MPRRPPSRNRPRVEHVAPAPARGSGREAVRRGARVLGLFRARERAGWVDPFDPAGPGPVAVPGAFRHGAEDGDAVVVEVLRASADGAVADGKILENLGRMSRPGTDVEVAIRRHALEAGFPDDTLAAAAALPSGIPAREASRRERFDDPAPVTIDGETAKDFDDAIAVAHGPRGGTRLYVHIADVSHFVAEGGPLDLAARERATSVYFPGRVVPMFPERLSNDLCSLVPGEDRLVQSAILDFDGAGRLQKARFADGVIRSRARLTYGEAAEMMAGKDGKGRAGREVAEMLRRADGLRGILERSRIARGSIDFDLPEPRILLDVDGAVTGVVVEPRNHAHRAIEEFMLAANEAVAARLERAEAPCLYRVHDPPDPAKVEALAGFAAGFGLALEGAGEGKVTSRAIQRMLEQTEGRPEHALLAQVALRSMMQARYDPGNTGHFGLAARVYTHFTSPIRRYPDLVVHRALRAVRERRAERLEALSLGIAHLATHCSTREREAEAAEREVLEWRKVAWLQGREGDRFEGVVTGVAPFGLFVRLSEVLVDGLVRVERLGDDWFDHSPARHELRGRRGGKRFRLGDRMEVVVTRVDPALRRIDLLPASRPEEPAVSPRGRKKGRSRRR